jgi:hypothetical protein
MLAGAAVEVFAFEGADFLVGALNFSLEKKE